ncbi:MAG: hypothetical protein ACRD15_09425 [Vicinamibacterales bacterium]
MTIKRAALYIGGASLLVAWLSSAASLSLQRNHRREPVTETAEPVVELTAGSVDAKRLKERLASAPLPQHPIRNPFVFRTVDAPRRAVSTQRLEAALAAPLAVPADLDLLLIGIAEDRKAQETVRTAMIVAESDQLIVAAVGDVVLQRYKVTAIGADAVELADVATGIARRLALQYQ